MHTETQVTRICNNVHKGELTRNDVMLLSLLVENLAREVKDLPTEEEVRAFEEAEGYAHRSV